MTTYVVPDGMKRKFTAEEWEVLLENRIPELIRRAKVGNFDPEALNTTLQKVIEGIVIGTLVPRPKLAILEFISTVTISATKEKFVASRNFLLKQEGGICSYLGTNFKAWFLEGDGKIEEPIGNQTLCYHRLQVNSKDDRIIEGLGGEAKAETTLSEMFYLMRRQNNGKAGVLLVNGYANIFYIRDQSGVLRAVSVCWYAGGWDVDASPVGYPGGWGAEDQVFSRKPSETLATA